MDRKDTKLDPLVAYPEEWPHAGGERDLGEAKIGRHLSPQEQAYIHRLLTATGLVGQIWPVYRWDETPAVYGLIVGRDMALQELNFISQMPITERQLRTVLKKFGIAEGPIEPELIEEFYRKRRDRKIGKTSGQ